MKVAAIFFAIFVILEGLIGFYLDDATFGGNFAVLSISSSIISFFLQFDMSILLKDTRYEISTKDSLFSSVIIYSDFILAIVACGCTYLCYELGIFFEDILLNIY